MKASHVLSGVVLCALGATLAQAQFVPQRPSGLVLDSRTALAAQGVTSSTGQGDSNGYLLSATDTRISNAPALSQFRLWFNNGDHKIRKFGVLHEQGSMRADFADQNGDDPFRAAATWMNVAGSTGGTISAGGSGIFNVQLPPAPANTTLVLSGFMFERQEGTDNNLRSMSIKLNQETSIAQVSLIDDQSEDYRNVVQQTMMGGLIGNLPFGAIIGGVMSTESMIRAMVNEGRHTARPFVVTIQYAFIPNSRVAASGAVSGTSRSSAQMQGQRPGTGPIALRGFAMRFNNNDHHLLGFGLHLRGMPVFPGQNGAPADPITFQDNDLDDPIQWFVEYSTLR
jgi:hypothetical protein